MIISCFSGSLLAFFFWASSSRSSSAVLQKIAEQVHNFDKKYGGDHVLHVIQSTYARPVFFHPNNAKKCDDVCGPRRHVCLFPFSHENRLKMLKVMMAHKFTSTKRLNCLQWLNELNPSFIFTKVIFLISHIIYSFWWSIIRNIDSDIV